MAAHKSERRLEIEEKIPELFGKNSRKAYTTKEVMDNIDIDIDRKIYIEVMRRHDRIYEMKKDSVLMWIFPKLEVHSSLEERVSKLEDEVDFE